MSVEELLTNQEDAFVADEWAIDDVAGVELDVEKVSAPRREEVELTSQIGVSEAATWEECQEKTGKAPLAARWIDANKGTDEVVVMRS